MLGLETVDAQIARASRIEERIAAAPTSEVLPEARRAYADALAELRRDQRELDAMVRANGGPPSFDPARVFGGLANATALVEAQQEVAADRTALRRLADSLRLLNQRADADSYAALDTRSARLDGQVNDVDQVLLLSSVSSDARALERYNAYLPGEYVTPAEATTLALTTSEQPADVTKRLADYLDLLKRRGTAQPTAALLATTGDVEGSYGRFTAFRSSGLDADVAAILAVSTQSDTRALYDVIRGREAPPRQAALLAVSAAQARKTPSEVSELLGYFAEGRPLGVAAVLTAVAIASGREPDQVAAAQSRFIRAGYTRPDLATAAWALTGRSSPIMAALSAITEITRLEAATP